MIIALLRRTFLTCFSLFVLVLISYQIMLKDPLNQNLGGGWFNGLVLYLHNLCSGDFGISYNGGESLRLQILSVLPATLELCILALLLAIFFGVCYGILGAYYADNWFGKTTRIISSLSLAIPIYWVSPILLYLAATHHWAISSVGQYNLLYEIKPITGFPIIDMWLIDQPYRIKIIQNVLLHLALPTLVLMITPFLEITRLTQQRAEIIFAQSYIKVATTRGWSKCKILRFYVLHNTLMPLIPSFIRIFTLTLALCMLIENIFNWSGIGQWLILALAEQDYNSVAIGVLVIGIVVITINLIAAFVTFLLDPFNRKNRYA
ncbi:peptide ABC transporter permease [Mergibacter septicus]|uniref:Peptide ABC transporter permease n=1 Tax=Mergibacter septicus TaxID=221402 RepID=A0A8D4LLF9_9PAST|nr:ABC transporter permease subunit [Mergibacter septicus]AWX13113.1 peptide ABC transporter permease [Mergibacter septicus]AWX15016.1 peptide ABC transporter permease [Mergibacter septicus]QDJ12533.1 peptide ABC transporter permease [Mergibacter septicus]QDJ14268.1 peptide ABC transporter permease [Mergibacter septicus]UTU48288.1 ABC transporter permease subunit [Mergibacter septicus]